MSAIFDKGIKIINSKDVTAQKVTVQSADGTLGYQDSLIFDKLSTGLLTGGVITINADTTKYNVSATTGLVSNFSDPNLPVFKTVNYAGITGKVSTYLATSNITYIGLDENGVLLEQVTPFTNSQDRDIISLGAVIHSNRTNINTVNNIGLPNVGASNQLHDLMEAIGALNLSGNKFSANGANLKLNKSAGVLFKLGSNAQNDWKNPHQIAQGATTALTFRYRTQAGVEGLDITDLDPSKYDLSGVLTTVPPNKYTVQTITLFQAGAVRIQYGQNIYNSLDEAEKAIATRSFVSESNIAQNGVNRGYVIMKHNTSSLQNASDAKLIEITKFGGLSSGGLALTFANITAALGYIPEDVSNKQNSLDVDGTGSKYPTVDAVNKSIVHVTAEQFGAVGDGVVNDAVAIQDAIESIKLNGGVLVFKSGKTYRINNTITLYSNITILGYGAKVELGAHTKNMFVTKGYLDGITRTSNIKIIGGTYDAKGFSGTNIENIRFIFHHSDNVIIKDAIFLSTAGKYILCFGDTKNVTITDCKFYCSSDGIHLMGKNYNTIVKNIYGEAGDDIIAMTTEDYVSYKFEEGDIQGVYLSDIKGANATRLVLLGNTKYTIKDVFVNNIEQTGTGAILTVGDGGTADATVQVDNLQIKNAKGSSILLRHRNMGSVTIENTNGNIDFARELSTGFCGIAYLKVKTAARVFFEPYVLRATIVDLEDIKESITTYGDSDLLKISNSKITRNISAIRIGGITNRALISNCTLKSTGTGNDPLMFFDNKIDYLIIENSSLGAGSNSAPILNGSTSNSRINNFTIQNSTVELGKSIYASSYVGTETVVLNFNNLEVGNINRLVEDNSTASFIIKYSNVRISSAANAVFRFYGTQNVKVYGSGWESNQPTFATGTTNITCYAQDLPVDVSLINATNGSRAYNTNASVLTGVGLVANNGGTWFNVVNSASSLPIKPSAIIITSQPTTSALAYDFLTRNTSTGIVEKTTSVSVAPTASPAFTGTPTAPTATAGTNTTQIATTAFVQGSFVNLTGNQSKTGILTLQNPVDANTQVNGLVLDNSGIQGSSSLVLNNYSNGRSVYLVNSGNGQGINMSNSSGGSGIFLNNSSGGNGIYCNNTSYSNGLYLVNNSTGKSLYSYNLGTGNAVVSDGATGSTGFVFAGQNNGTTTFSVTKEGVVKGSSIVKEGGLATQFLKADGGVSVGYKVYTALISQTGTSAPVATVLENTLGGAITWTRTGIGTYRGTLTGGFTINKTYCSVSNGFFSDSIGFANTTVNIVDIVTSGDSLINNASLEIRVYN